MAIFGGPDDGRPNLTPNTSTPTTPNYDKQIDRWRDKMGDLGKGHKKKKKDLRGRIQDARVARWSDGVQAAADAPTPKDSTYNSDIASANQQYGNTMIGAAMRESATNRNFGFDPQYQEGGAQYNPYSRASELTAAWNRDQRTTLNSYAAQGQLYSGARENARNRDNRNYLSDYNTARTDMLSQIAAIRSDEVQAQTDLDNAEIAAEEANMQRALETPPEAAPPPPKFIKREKKDLKNKLETLRERRADAGNKFAKKKIKKTIKRTKQELKDIPGQYDEVSDEPTPPANEPPKGGNDGGGGGNGGKGDGAKPKALKNKLEDLKDRRADANNKFARQKITKKIKRTKKKLKS